VRSTAVEIDRPQHFATLANASVPGGVVGVEADAVGDAVAEVSPRPPVAVSRAPPP
jgi:hypothetical protein